MERFIFIECGREINVCLFNEMLCYIAGFKITLLDVAVAILYYNLVLSIINCKISLNFCQKFLNGSLSLQIVHTCIFLAWYADISNHEVYSVHLKGQHVTFN
jgi:hypothetical protein